MDTLSTQDLRDHADDLETRGYTILRDVISPEFVDEICLTIAELEAELESNPSPASRMQATALRKNFEGQNSRRLTSDVLARRAVFDRIITFPLVVEMAEMLLGAQPLVQTIVTLGVGPGNAAQALHVDDMYLPLARPHQALSVNFIWALTDFTSENGATVVAPGTHLYAAEPRNIVELAGVRNQTSYADLETAVMSKGSILVTHGSVVHGAGANLTDGWRYGLAVDYCAGWIRQRENLALAIPLDSLSHMSTKAQELIGVRGRFGGHLGQIALHDPADVLFGGGDA